VRDCGTLVLLFLATNEGQTVPIHLDRCPFRWLLEGEGCGPGELVGSHIRYAGGRIVSLDGEAPK
jgi:hypothetical protein